MVVKKGICDCGKFVRWLPLFRSLRIVFFSGFRCPFSRRVERLEKTREKKEVRSDSKNERKKKQEKSLVHGGEFNKEKGGGI